MNAGRTMPPTFLAVTGMPFGSQPAPIQINMVIDMQKFDPAQFHDGFEEMRAILHQAWQKDLVAGFSGNASLVLPGGQILITGSGVAKGRLKAQDLCVLDRSGNLLGGQKPSSEAKMHLAIYAAREDCRAILHTHPPKLLALGLRLKDELEKSFLDLPLYEAGVFRKALAIAPAAEPGSQELAHGAANAAKAPSTRAVWLKNHGLCALGNNLETVLALSEEMEHLAGVQLACGL